MSKYTHWRVSNPQRHKLMKGLTSSGAGFGVTLVIGYYLLHRIVSGQFETLYAAGLFLAGFPIGWAYHATFSGAPESKA